MGEEVAGRVEHLLAPTETCCSYIQGVSKLNIPCKYVHRNNLCIGRREGGRHHNGHSTFIFFSSLSGHPVGGRGRRPWQVGGRRRKKEGRVSVWVCVCVNAHCVQYSISSLSPACTAGKHIYVLDGGNLNRKKKNSQFIFFAHTNYVKTKRALEL